MKEILFLVEDAPEGGVTARALGHAIFTEADDREALRAAIDDALECPFGAPHPTQLVARRPVSTG